MDQYHERCKDCEYLYHCFSTETAEAIENDEADEFLYLRPDSCISYYPLRKG